MPIPYVPAGMLDWTCSGTLKLHDCPGCSTASRFRLSAGPSGQLELRYNRTNCRSEVLFRTEMLSAIASPALATFGSVPFETSDAETVNAGFWLPTAESASAEPAATAP